MTDQVKEKFIRETAHPPACKLDRPDVCGSVPYALDVCLCLLSKVGGILMEPGGC